MPNGNQSPAQPSSSMPGKRTGINSATGRVIKRRAPTACQGCRARKVRCNVLEHGPPCTNCRLDDIQCTVSMGKRRLRFANLHAEDFAGNVFVEKPQAPQPEFDITTILQPDVPRFEIAGGDTPTPPSSVPQAEARSNRNFNSNHQPHSIYQGLNPSRRHPAQLPDPQLPIKIPVIPPNAGLSLGNGADTRTPSPGSGPSYILPKWVKPLPDRIMSDDADYLRKKGALTLPDSALRNELLDCFAAWVHPWTPVVDMDQLLHTMCHEDESEAPLSLLLIQAIMFAGAGFANLDLLKSFGFESRKEAKQAFFTRAKILYDFEYENDRITLVQALVLMSYWHNSPDDQKDIWHWMGVALSLAYTVGLHRNPAVLKMPLAQKRLRKRIWWSLFIRDRIVALSIRRSIRIVEEDCTVPMLDLDDFETQPRTACRRCREFENGIQRRNAEKQRDYAMLCIQEAKLCAILGRILLAQYSVVCIEHHAQIRDVRNNKTTMVLLPKKHPPAFDVTLALESELVDWSNGLPDELVYRTPAENTDISDIRDMMLYRAILAMLYETAVTMLHRPQSADHGSVRDYFQIGMSPGASSSPSSMCSATKTCREASLEKTRAAAFTVSRILTELSILDLIRFMPTFGVTTVVHSAILHLVDARSQDKQIRNKSILGLSQSMKAMHQLCDMYIAAEYAIFLLNEGISKSNIRRPLNAPEITSLAAAAQAFPPQPSLGTTAVASSPVTQSSRGDSPVNRRGDFDQPMPTPIINEGGGRGATPQLRYPNTINLLVPETNPGIPTSPDPTGTAFLDRMGYLQGFDYMGLENPGPYPSLETDWGLGYGLEWLAETGNSFPLPEQRQVNSWGRPEF